MRDTVIYVLPKEHETIYIYEVFQLS